MIAHFVITKGDMSLKYVGRDNEVRLSNDVAKSRHNAYLTLARLEENCFSCNLFVAFSRIKTNYLEHKYAKYMK